MASKEVFLLSRHGKALTLPQAVTQLRFLDDEMMRTALQDQTELVEFMLQIIMRKPDLKVTSLKTQKDIRQPGGGRSLILDVWAVDSEGTQYNIEIQRDPRGATAVRARYHGAALDVASLQAAQNVRMLPQTRIIFITEHDCIGDGKLLHRFGMRDLDDGTPLDTGQQILYLNTAFEGTADPGDEQLADLAHDFRCSDPGTMKLEPLADRMRFLKDTEKGRVQMSNIVEQYARQEAEKAVAQALAEAAAAQALLQAEADAAVAQARKDAEAVTAQARKDVEAATAQAVQATQLDIAQKLLSAGKMSVPEIAAITGLSHEQVQAACSPQQNG